MRVVSILAPVAMVVVPMVLLLLVVVLLMLLMVLLMLVVVLVAGMVRLILIVALARSSTGSNTRSRTAAGAAANCAVQRGELVLELRTLVMGNNLLLLAAKVLTARAALVSCGDCRPCLGRVD